MPWNIWTLKALQNADQLKNGTEIQNTTKPETELMKFSNWF